MTIRRCKAPGFWGEFCEEPKGHKDRHKSPEGHVWSERREQCNSYYSSTFNMRCILVKGHDDAHATYDPQGYTLRWTGGDDPETISPRRKVLEEATTLTHGDRDKNYGDPYTNHERIAGMWSIYLGYDITAEQVAVCMALLKIARLAHQPGHHDSYVDGAAYLAIAAELSEYGDV